MLFFFQAEDGIRDLVRSRGLGDVYKRQVKALVLFLCGRVTKLGVDQNLLFALGMSQVGEFAFVLLSFSAQLRLCLLYTSDAADERSSVDLGGRRIIKKKKKLTRHSMRLHYN